ncbi:MAG: hypothetical protein GKR89_24425 [Candidatus Latescibacteria bacterium]|nr:hypothetical protein [Candidatus Latescibacterota bacterium]
MDSTIVGLEERLARLEGENQRLRRQGRWVLVLVAVLCGAVLLVAREGDELVAQGLSVRDEAGRLRARIGLDAEGQLAQSFFDSAGVERIRLGIAADGTARQRLFDQEGWVRVSSSTYPEDHPKAPGVAGSVYYDKSETKRIRLATDAKGQAVQQFKDGQGENRLVTKVDTAGAISGELK